MKNNKVCIYINKELNYPLKAPYHPDKSYPELQTIFGEVPTDTDNHVYDALRRLFRMLDLDSRHYNTERWNPLSKIITPDDTVLIKPNFVMHEYESQVGNNAMHTHGSIIRAIGDYALLALNGTGKLIIADSPLQEADFNMLVEETGLVQIKHWYSEKGINNVFYYDLRKEWAVLSGTGGVIVKHVPLAGDPRGYKIINLGRYSALEPITTTKTKFSITNYSDIVTQKHHCPGRHEYLISQTVLDADVILNVPHLKTHMKTGITCCLKNLVGINISKDYLPHHRLGSITEGGDEFPRKTTMNILFKKTRKSLKGKLPLWLWKILRPMALTLRNFYTNFFEKHNDISVSLVNNGNWYGNDTVWRMVHDMNKIIFFANKGGHIRNKKQRRYFTVVDAIVAGEGNGPLMPTAKQCRTLLAGFDPLAVDTAAALMMGFDPNKIPLLANHGDFKNKLDISCWNEHKGFLSLESMISLFDFIPPTGWKYHIELEK